MIVTRGQSHTGGLARRKPMLLFVLSGLFLLRFAERTLCGLLFQEPPRFTRLAPDPIPCEREYLKKLPGATPWYQHAEHDQSSSAPKG